MLTATLYMYTSQSPVKQHFECWCDASVTRSRQLQYFLSGNANAEGSWNYYFWRNVILDKRSIIYKYWMQIYFVNRCILIHKIWYHVPVPNGMEAWAWSIKQNIKCLYLKLHGNITKISAHCMCLRCIIFGYWPSLFQSGFEVHILASTSYVSLLRVPETFVGYIALC